jgi:hypothetical protein
LSVDPPTLATGEEGNDADDVAHFADAPEGAILAIVATNSSFFPLRKSSVATGPGTTALTVMFRGPSSFARTRVSPSTPDFEAI